MFGNIGGKIKGLAAFICWLGIIGSVLGGIGLAMLGDEIMIIIGVAVAIVGSLMSWIGSFILYGYGQLIYNTDILVKNAQNGNISAAQLLQGIQPVAVAPVQASGAFQSAQPMSAAPAISQWRCDGCGNMISKEICPFCGKPHGNAAKRISVLQSLCEDGIITQEEYNAKLEKIKD